MPEARETEASGMVAEEGLSTAQAAGADMTVVKLVYDPSAVEAASANATELARQGLPCTLEPTADVFRGNLNQQTSIYPSVLKPLPTNYPPVPYLPVLKSLVLSGVQLTYCALILNFSTLFLMVRFKFVVFSSSLVFTLPRFNTSLILRSNGTHELGGRTQ
jgi:hypothetical protein